MISTRVLLTALACVQLLAVPPAEARGDRENGRLIAERWCAACHLVTPDQTSSAADIATFAEIARVAPDDLSVLEGFLADPHPVMPDMSLSRQEIRDLVAYIGSLR
jgi:mono/diheme cytochrome c family protein